MYSFLNSLSRSFFLLLLLPFIFFQSPARAQTSKVVFSTGGSFNAAGNLVTLYSKAPGNMPEVELKRPGDFSNAVHVDGSEVYFHVGRAATHPDGQDLIMRYDLVNKQVLDSAVAPGTQAIATTADHLIVTRGFGADSAYVLVFDKTNLSQGPVFQDTSIKEFCSELLIQNDKLWVSYDSAGVGMLARFNLAQGNIGFEQRYMLDSLAAGMSHLYIYNDSLLALAQVSDFPPPDFNEVVRHASLVRVDPTTGGFSIDLGLNRVNNPVALVGDLLYANYGGGLQGLDLGSMAFTDTLSKADYTAGVYNEPSMDFFLQETDYFSFGRLARVDPANSANNQNFATDISGSAVAMAYDLPTSLSGDLQTRLSAYPNPASTWIKVNWGTPMTHGIISVMDMQGKTMLSTEVAGKDEVVISLHSLPAGIYVLRVDGGEKVATKRFMKSER
jgi:hypothetical protein